MKTRPIFVIKIALLFSLFFATNQGFTKPLRKGSTMELTIKKYAKGADERNLDFLNTAFHENFVVNAITKDGLKSMNKNSYLQLIKSKKIGGIARTLKILKMSDDGVIGTAKITLTSSKVTFHDNITLLKENNQWKIISNVTRVIPNVVEN